MIDKVREYASRGKSRYAVLGGVVFVFLIAGVIMVSSLKLTRHSLAATPPGRTGVGMPSSFADLAEELGPAVVNIKVIKLQRADLPEASQFSGTPFGEMFKHFFNEMPRSPDAFRTQGAGSGVIISEDGKILTNYHVIEGAKEIMITMNDKREFKARTIGRDAKTDLAVLQIDGKGSFRPAILGNSDSLRVGEWVLAIGNPFGLSNTVTSGIVSAKGRVIGAGPYDDFVQTDAPINPGNSGGPLFNMKGEVIGINTAIIPNGQGIGFAIPVNTAKSLLPQLVSKGSVTRGYLGVSVQNVTDDLAASLNLKTVKGVLVSDVVEGSPAEKGGVRQGDVIMVFNGKEIKEGHELSSLVAASMLDKEVPMRVMRDGKEINLTVRVARLPSDDKEKQEGVEVSKGKWGLQLQNLNAETARQMGLNHRQGVVVVGVQPGSPADLASVQRGDIILEVNRHSIKDVDGVRREAQETEKKGSLLLLVQRDKGKLYLVLKG